jgi:nicotinate-nucleotide pyrophosphorylase (carboxylating)
MTSSQNRSATPHIVHESSIHRIVENAVMEDLGVGDITTDAIVEHGTRGKAEIISKAKGVIAGMEIARLVFQTIDAELTFSPIAQDGTEVGSMSRLATVEGELASILKAERTALNILQRMSGIATLTRAFVTAVSGTRATITDTRKTPPGLRVLDKLAVKTGGGVNHRFGLDDMVLIKDNHIAAAGSISAAIKRCVEYLDSHHIKLPIEVETKNLDEVRECLRFEKIDRIMLDNYSTERMREAVTLIGGEKEVEASGNVSLENVRSVAETRVDFISIGALTHSVKALDISLEIIAEHHS